MSKAKQNTQKKSYTKIINKERNEYILPTGTSRHTPCMIDGVRYDSIKQASEAIEMNPPAVRSRMISTSDKFSKWILLTDEKIPKLTVEELAERKRKTSAKWNAVYKDNNSFREYYQVKSIVDLQFRLKNRYKSIVSSSLKNNHQHKDFEILTGISLDGFRKHITDRQSDFFTRWSRTDMQLDHIKSIASFDMTSLVDVLTCFHHTNYQPLSAIENRQKGAK